MLQSTSLLTILGKKVIIKKNIIQEVLLMVKNKLAVAAVFTIAFSLSTIYVNAQVKILKQYTNYTYAKYELHRPAQRIHRTTETSER